MGDTHYRSNLKAASRDTEISGWGEIKCGTVTATVGEVGTNTVTTASINTLNVHTEASIGPAGALKANAPDFTRGSYVKLGPSVVMYWGNTMWRTLASVASAIASMEEIVGDIASAASPLPGCLFLNTAATAGIGGLWARGSTAASWLRPSIGQ